MYALSDARDVICAASRARLLCSFGLRPLLLTATAALLHASTTLLASPSPVFAEMMVDDGAPPPPEAGPPEPPLETDEAAPPLLLAEEGTGGGAAAPVASHTVGGRLQASYLASLGGSASGGAAKGASAASKQAALAAAIIASRKAHAAGMAATGAHGSAGAAGASGTSVEEAYAAFTPDAAAEAGARFAAFLLSGKRWDAPLVAPTPFLHRFPSIDALTLEVTLPGGQRAFVEHAPVQDAFSAGTKLEGAPSCAGLLQAPIGELLAAVRDKIAAEERVGGKAAAAAAAAAAASLTTSPASSSSSRAPALWVDKYSPRAFADLLSPETVNRNVMRWVKLWDAKVFKPSAGAAAAASRGAPSSPAGAADAAPGSASKGKKVASLFLTRGSPRKKARLADGAAGEAEDDKAARSGGEEAEEEADRDRRRKVPAGGRGAAAAAAAAPPPPPSAAATTAAAILQKFGYGWKRDAKVLLLAGPPGTGKTTLAHMVARQAGYRAAEINASDDRSGKTIRERIVDAQSNRAVFGDKRPALVILDEIDGMEGGKDGGIAELVRMIKATPSLLAKEGGGGGGGGGGDEEGAGSGGSDSEGGGGGAAAAPAPTRRGGSKATGPGSAKKGGAAAAAGADGEGGAASRADAAHALNRPLICICNDQYAPALRELRPLVQIIEFTKPSPDRLLARLRSICSAEGLAVSQDALQSLIALTDGDIRSCLNTLQFIRYQSGGSGGLPGAVRVTAEMIAKAAVGVKDQTKALFDVWEAVFKVPDTKLRSTLALQSLGIASTADFVAAATHASATAAGAGKGEGATSRFAFGGQGAAALRAAHIADINANMSAYAAEGSLLLSGLFENVHASRASDPTLAHASAALDWLCWGEELLHRVTSTASHVLLRYFGAAGVGVHLHLATDLQNRLVWPRTDSRNRGRFEQRSNILRTFVLERAKASAACACAGALDTRTVVLDLLGPLLTIVSPALRPSAITLANSAEKAEALRLVSVLESNGLTFAAKMTQDRFDVEEASTWGLAP